MMGLRKVPGRKSEAGSRGVPPQAPALSPDLPDSPLHEPRAAPRSPQPGGDPYPHERSELGPGTDSPACTWVLRPTLSPGRERPVRGVPSESSASPPREPPGVWGPLMEQAGWGVSPDQGSPLPTSSHRGRARQGGWGPWRLLPAVQAVRMEKTWVPSRQRDPQAGGSLRRIFLVKGVTSVSPQKEELSLPGSLAFVSMTEQEASPVTS